MGERRKEKAESIHTDTTISGSTESIDEEGRGQSTKKSSPSPGRAVDDPEKGHGARASLYDLEETDEEGEEEEGGDPEEAKGGGDDPLMSHTKSGSRRESIVTATSESEGTEGREQLQPVESSSSDELIPIAWPGPKPSVSPPPADPAKSHTIRGATKGAKEALIATPLPPLPSPYKAPPKSARLTPLAREEDKARYATQVYLAQLGRARATAKRVAPSRRIAQGGHLGPLIVAFSGVARVAHESGGRPA